MEMLRSLFIGLFVFTRRLLRERAEGSMAIPLDADSALSRSLLLTGSQRGREGNHLFHLEAEEENL